MAIHPWVPGHHRQLGIRWLASEPSRKDEDGTEVPNTYLLCGNQAREGKWVTLSNCQLIYIIVEQHRFLCWVNIFANVSYSGCLGYKGDLTQLWHVGYLPQGWFRRSDCHLPSHPLLSFSNGHGGFIDLETNSRDKTVSKTRMVGIAWWQPSSTHNYNAQVGFPIFPLESRTFLTVSFLGFLTRL